MMINDRYWFSGCGIIFIDFKSIDAFVTAGTDLQLLNQDTCCFLQTAIRFFGVYFGVRQRNFVAFGPSQMYASSSVKLVFLALQLMKFR
jgi:hypothetical protein